MEGMRLATFFCLDSTYRVSLAALFLSGARVDAQKRVLLEVCPRVLVLHINRTAWQLGMHKIHTHVNFPFDLSLGPFCAHDATSEVASVYTLRSVVAHHGNQMSGGHFTAFGRASVGDTDAWLHFNDARVTEVTRTEVAGAQAYILLYERQCS